MGIIPISMSNNNRKMCRNKALGKLALSLQRSNDWPSVEPLSAVQGRILVPIATSCLITGNKRGFSPCLVVALQKMVNIPPILMSCREKQTGIDLNRWYKFFYEFCQFENNTIFVSGTNRYFQLTKKIYCGVRQQRKKNGKRLQQAHQGWQTQNVLLWCEGNT